MKMLVDYLDRAMQFEHMAAVEVNPDLKATFLKQRRTIGVWQQSGRLNLDCTMQPHHYRSETLDRRGAAVWAANRTAFV
jgi:hypothetical protein